MAAGGVWTVRIEGENPIAELQALGGQTIQNGVLTFTDNRTRQLSVKIAATSPRANEGEVIDLSSVGGTTTLSVTCTAPTVAPEVISVTSLFTYNGRTYAAASAVLAEVLPVETRVVEGTDAGTYTVYFDFAVVGGRKVTEFKAALAQGQNQTGVELGEAESETSLRLTLAGPSSRQPSRRLPRRTDRKRLTGKKKL